MTLKIDVKFQEKLICCFKNDLFQKHLHFHWFLLCKVFKVWPKKVQRSYLSWQWRVMQNLKKNWLVIWKMTWGIWQIFTRAIESLKIGTLMGSFNPKYERKIHRGVMCHDNEEWCKTWRGIDFSFQNWHWELINFDPSTYKSQKF